MQSWLLLFFLFFGGDRAVLESVIQSNHAELTAIRNSSGKKIKLGMTGIPVGDFYFRTRFLSIQNRKPDRQIMKSIFSLPIPVHYRIIALKSYVKIFYAQRTVIPKIKTKAIVKPSKTRPIRDEVIEIEFEFLEPRNQH